MNSTKTSPTVLKLHTYKENRNNTHIDLALGKITYVQNMKQQNTQLP